MTSQNSSQAELGHSLRGQLWLNMKRRLWLFGLNIAALLLYFPIQFLANLSSADPSLFSEKGVLYYYQAMMLNGVGCGNIIFIGILASAVIAAFSGFAYLYDSAKVDFYHSQPVGMGERFIFTYLTGFLAFIIPILVFDAAVIGFGSFYKVVDSNMVSCICLLVLMQILLFMTVYHTAILAVSLTGTYLSGACAVAALLGTEWAVRRLVYSYASGYLHTFCSLSKESILSPKVTGALVQLEMIHKIHSYVGGYDEKRNHVITPEWMLQKTGMSLLRLAILVLIMLALAYFCYRRRDGSKTGLAVSEKAVGILANIVATSIAGISIGWLIGRVSGEKILLCVVGLVFGCTVAFLSYELIFERRFSVCLKNSWQLACGLAVAIFFYLSFSMDLFGYDSKMYDADQVEKTGVLLTYYDGMYLFDPVQIDDIENSDKEAVLMLMAEDYYHNRTGEKEKADGENDQSGKEELQASIDVVVALQLKNGKTVFRNCFIDPETGESTLNRIVKDEIYRRNVYPLLTLSNKDLSDKIVVTLSTYFDNRILDQSDQNAFFACYRKELEQLDYTTMKECTQIGEFNLSVPDGAYNGREVYYPIYDTFIESIAFLQKEGYLPEDGRLTPEASEINELEVDIEKSSVGDFIPVYFYEPQEIQAILSVSEPVNFGSEWKDRRNYYEKIAVYIQTEIGYNWYKIRKDHPIPEPLLEYVEEE